MSSALIGAVVGAILGGAVSFWLSRRRVTRAPAAVPPAEGPPLLEWILRANGAIGAWLIGPGTREVAVPKEGISEELDRVVLARLEHQRIGDGQGVERLGSGTLVFASLDGRAAGLQLPPGSSTGVRATAQRDLARLLDYDRWRPVLAAVVKDQDTRGESVESVALRLAMQLEKMLGVEICVAVPRSKGVEIAGVSLRSDKRLLNALVEQGSTLEQVTLGQADAQAAVVAPFGTVRADRRKRGDPAYVCPIPGEAAPAGAIAAWTAEGAEPAMQLAAFRAAIEAAGPRLLGALERRALEEVAARDPLTGLRNRRGFDEVMTSFGDPSGALIYTDIDYFKSVNDQLGHPAGDSALLHMSKILMRAVRDDDTIARIGGEEFAIWLPLASLERGREVAERIRQALAFSEWRWQGGERWRLTASFGVAACPETAPTRAALPAQADAALYEAKRGGRDRVAVAGEATSQPTNQEPAQ